MVLQKVKTVRDELRALFPEREAEIESLLLGAIAQEHVLLIGPPGTAKSALARAFCAALEGGAYFEWLLTRFSTPEELFGPVSLAALKRDRYRRVTDGKLPKAHIVFLDEIFKANSAILNALLAAMQERVFHCDGAAQPIPLVTLIGASNELPRDELVAVADRFLLRHFVSPLRRRENFALVLAAARERQRRGGRMEPAVRLTLQDLQQAREEVEQVEVGPEIIDRMWDLRRELGTKGIEITSDRRWVACVKIVAAHAWLHGEAEAASTEDFAPLQHCLWQEPEQEAEIRRVVAQYAAPELAEATEIHDALIEKCAQLPPAGDASYEQQLAAANRELRKGVGRLKELHKSARSPRARQQIADLGRTLQQRGKEMRAALIGLNDLGAFE